MNNVHERRAKMQTRVCLKARCIFRVARVTPKPDGKNDEIHTHLDCGIRLNGATIASGAEGRLMGSERSTKESAEAMSREELWAIPSASKESKGVGQKCCRWESDNEASKPPNLPI